MPGPDRLLTPDLCVIGAGSGGLSVAAGAAQLGASVVLIEGAEMGGDCLNFGCVPSKALIAAAHAAQALRAGGPGLPPRDPQPDFPAAMAHVRAAVAAIAPHDSQERFAGMGVTVIREWAGFASPTEVRAGPYRIRARRFVIATGSQAKIPRLPGLAAVPYLTNETVFALTACPEHLLVLGGGPVGCELAQAFHRLGARVTLIQRHRLLPREDAEAAALVRDRLQAEGIDVLEMASVTQVGPGPILALSNGETRRGSHLLVATGRAPALDRLNLPAAEIDFTPQGITTDARLRTTNPRVFAIGDAAGMEQFTQVAAYHAGLVVRQALFGLPVRLRRDHLTRATFTDPELAQVGPTEAEARAAHGPALTVARADFGRNDRAITEAATTGFVKVMVVKGRVIGATVVGPGAGELIAPWSLAVASRLKMARMASLITAYPTRADLTRAVVSAYYSPRLFANPWLKRFVSVVQRVLP